MSGPKPMIVTVDDEIQLDRSLSEQIEHAEHAFALLSAGRRATDAVRDHLAHLGKKLDDLRRLREERRQLRAEEEAQRCETMRGVYRAAHAALSASADSRASLLAQYPGINLPAPPIMPVESDLASEAAIRAALMEINRISGDYQAQVDRALRQYLEAAENAGRLHDWIVSFRSGAARGADEVIQALEDGRVFTREAALRDRLRRIGADAAELLRRELACADDRDAPGATRLPPSILDTLDRIYAAPIASAAHSAYEELRVEVDEEKNRRAQQRQTLEAQRAEAAARKRAIDARTIADQLARALEDLGYDTSDISDVAYSREGHLYAIDRQWPEHALQFAFDAVSGRMVASAVRITSEGDDQPVDGPETITADTNFDTAWCGQDGVGRIRKQLQARGIEATFKVEHAPGEVALPRVSEAVLNSRQRARRNARHAEGRSKVRQRERKQ